MTTRAYVLEFDERAIGIVVPDGSRHVRFFSAGPPFDEFDGRRFGSAREVLAAARAHTAKGGRRAAAPHSHRPTRAYPARTAQ